MVPPLLATFYTLRLEMPASTSPQFLVSHHDSHFSLTLTLSFHFFPKNALVSLVEQLFCYFTKYNCCCYILSSRSCSLSIHILSVSIAASYDEDPPYSLPYDINRCHALVLVQGWMRMMW